MLSNVPQFIDLEDHIVGPLTAKQLGWSAIGFVLLLVLWNLLEFTYFLVAAIFVVALVVALGFYKPNGRPFIYFITDSFFFLFKSKTYVWRRMPEERKVAPKVTEEVKIVKRKQIETKQLEEITRLLEKGH